MVNLFGFGGLAPLWGLTQKSWTWTTAPQQQNLDWELPEKYASAHQNPTFRAKPGHLLSVRAIGPVTGPY